MNTETEYKFQLQKQLITGENESPSTTTNINGLSFRSLLMDHFQDPYVLSLLPSPQNDDDAKLEMVRQTRQKRREKLSDRTRCLQKLLPMDKKMDMATVLEESYKYIKFLEAQVRVLHSMPCVTTNDATFGVDMEVGDLARLNRQELLQVVVNSQAAQALLSSNGCCIYSVEQLVKLNAFHQKRVTN